MSKKDDVLKELQEIHNYVKSNYKYFHYKYESSITSMEKVRDRVRHKKKVGFTCLVPLRLALHKVGLKRSDGKSLFYAKNGTFKNSYSGSIKSNTDRITKGDAIGLTVKQVVDKKLLKSGDILAFKGHTHTFVYSGDGYICFDGGGACKDYSKGIRIDYSKHYKNCKISEIIRWKTTDKKTEKTTTKEVKDMTKQEVFINKVAPMAVKNYVNGSDILPSITISQSILESGWGTTDLCKNGNALFGIKKHDWKGKTYTKKSYEYEHGKKVLRTSVFRAYDSWQESINDHSKYLRTRKVDGKNLTYKSVVGEKDFKKAAKALQKAGYSTYPDYSDQLIRIINQYGLTKYDKDAEKQIAEKNKNQHTTTTTADKAAGSQKTTTTTKAEKKKSRIFLDAGHGGKDSGAVKGVRTEKADVLKLVLAIGEKLEAKGYTVGYARTTDIYESPSKKAADANDFKADYFFSFHRNCYNSKAHGYENLYYSHSTVKDAIMKDINAKMKAVGFEIRGDVKRTNLAVLKQTKAPSLLFEVGFIDSTNDNLIFDKKYNEIVNSYVDVILKHCK